MRQTGVGEEMKCYKWAGKLTYSDDGWVADAAFIDVAQWEDETMNKLGFIATWLQMAEYLRDMGIEDLGVWRYMATLLGLVMDDDE